MTSEVCMMNRLAVVLAADSATTVSRWVDGKREERYFKGANKIFQLSNRHPIGMMIFDSASILSVPWETIIKSFRQEIGIKSFNTVEDYASELFSYLNNNQRYFPEQKQIEQLARAAQGVSYGIIISAIKDVDDADRSAAIDSAFSEKDRALAEIGLPNGLNEDNVEQALGDTRASVSDVMGDFLQHIEVPVPANIDGWSDTAIREVIEAINRSSDKDIERALKAASY